jgi:hypothetical protein
LFCYQKGQQENVFRRHARLILGTWQGSNLSASDPTGPIYQIMTLQQAYKSDLMRMEKGKNSTKQTVNMEKTTKWKARQYQQMKKYLRGK